MSWFNDIADAVLDISDVSDYNPLRQLGDYFSGAMANEINDKYVAESQRRQYQANSRLQQEAQSFNAVEAEKSRAWQESMSNSAYQRAVKDMRKAHINPMLAISQGGATTPTGATAASTPASIGAPATTAAKAGSLSEMASIASSAYSVYGGLSKLGAEIANIGADTDLKQANKAAAAASALKDTAIASKTQQEAEGFDPEVARRVQKSQIYESNNVFGGLFKSIQNLFDNASSGYEAVAGKKFSEQIGESIGEASVNSARGLKSLVDKVHEGGKSVVIPATVDKNGPKFPSSRFLQGGR